MGVRSVETLKLTYVEFLYLEHTSVVVSADIFEVDVRLQLEVLERG